MQVCHILRGPLIPQHIASSLPSNAPEMRPVLDDFSTMLLEICRILFLREVQLGIEILTLPKKNPRKILLKVSALRGE